MSNPAPGFKAHPGHTITVDPFAGTVEVIANGETIARSTRALVLKEGTYPPVFYLPLSDVSAPITKSATLTHCPFKGDASYWNVEAGRTVIEDALWAYETPFDEMTAITNHAAFYPDRVDEIRATPV